MLLLLIISILLHMYGVIPTSLPNVPCKSLRYYVPIGKHSVSNPMTVALHRCHGRFETSNGDRKICVPKKNETVSIDYFSINGKKHNMTVQNHTECHEVCKKDNSSCNADQKWISEICLCDCNVKWKQCEKPLKWERLYCKCRCPYTAAQRKCRKGKVFSEELCRCVCSTEMLQNCTGNMKYLHPNTCQCMNEPVGAVSVDMCRQTGIISELGLVILTVSEAVISILAFVLWKKYLKAWLQRKRQQQKEEEEKRQTNADRCSVETPTIDANPNLSIDRTKSRLKKKKKKLSDKDRLDIHNRPFLGIAGSDRKFHKYRYEMGNLVLFTDNDGLEYFPEDQGKPIYDNENSPIDQRKPDEKVRNSNENKNYVEDESMLPSSGTAI